MNSDGFGTTRVRSPWAATLKQAEAGGLTAINKRAGLTKGPDGTLRNHSGSEAA